jgi:hypothetical protein
VYLSTDAFNRLRGLSGRTGRDVAIEASLILEAALLGIRLDRELTVSSVQIRRLAAAKTTGEKL